MLSRFFIHRPIFAAVIAIVTLIAGSVSLVSLPNAKFPEISPPTVKVTAFYPGASAQIVADTVASPIEQEVNGVEGSIYMSSTSASDGAYALTVTFEIGTDMDMASVLVQNRVAKAEPRLPEDVRRQGITTKKQSTSVILYITLTSTNPEHDALYLSNYAVINLKDELSRINGVGEVTIFGAGDYSMRIWLDPENLQSRNLTTQDVLAAIKEQNVQVAAGGIGQPPAPAGTSFQYTVNTQGRLQDVEQFNDLIIKTADDGRVTRVRDVARVEMGSKEYTINSEFNGRECSTIALYQLPGANAIEVATLTENKMKELNENFPEGLEFAVPYNTTLFVTESIAEVKTTLIQAVVLVFLVIFLFLQDWRATIIPAAAIPVSLIGTFAVLMGLGYSINMLTLFGIILAIGIVVDDAIVVVENTVRHIEEGGLSAKDAALKAMEEITGPVIATTLVLLAVFIPTAFMGGITGQLYRQFALTISAAVVFSTINALTLSPALAALLLRPPTGKKNFFFRGFNKGFDAVSKVYGVVIGVMVRRIVIVMILYLGLLVLTGTQFASLPKGFMPTEDQGYILVQIQLPDAASLERTSKVIRQLDDAVKEMDGVADRLAIGGYSILQGTKDSNAALYIVVLEPWSERSDASLSQEAILDRLRGIFKQQQDAMIFGFFPPAIDGLGTAGGFTMQLQDRGDLGLAQLQSLAEEMVHDGNAQSGLTAMNTTFRATVPQLFADIDREMVQNMNVPQDVVSGTLQAYLGSAYVNDFNRFGRTYQVRAQAEARFRAEPDDIKSLDVRNNSGDMVPMGAFTTVEDAFGPQSIQRFNLYPSAAINGESSPGYSSGEALLLMEQMAKDKLPQAMGFEWTGMSFQEKKSAKGQNLIFLLAVVFVFLVLAAQYESWSSPAAVIMVVPLAALGVAVAVLMRGMDNNTYTQIGVVLLVAMASKNAILIVEFARDARSKGMGVIESATAAARQRFRAILMTAISSICGFFPLVISAGAGAASRQAVGTAVVGGMIAATVFSVFLVPSFYVLLQGSSEWIASLLKGSSPLPSTVEPEGEG